MERREFLKKCLISTTALFVLNTRENVFACENFPEGIVYTKMHPGMWEKKIKSHIPLVEINKNKITITTNHPMSKRHYIVKHTLVSKHGRVLGSKTFYPEDKKAVSVFSIPDNYKGLLFATSFCNIHDLWLTELEI